MSETIIYGIPNCDTVRKTVRWFKEHKVPFRFHDYKAEGISNTKLKEWTGKLGWQTIFNSKSSIWRNMMKESSNTVLTESKAIRLMHENTSIIKRPLIETNGSIFAGFDEEILRNHFLKQ